MEDFKKFTLEHSELVCGGDLVPTGFFFTIFDLYDTETERWIFPA